jgi:hypothetical protein
MAGLDRDHIICSCNAAGMHFLDVRADYSDGDERELGGARYCDDIGSPTAWRGWTVNTEWARATQRGCTVLNFGEIIVAGMNRNLQGIDTSARTEAQRHGGYG